MSYCVNCGVELDHAAKECPLCNTPVLNPRELERIMKDRTPFPQEKGQVEAVKRKDIGILLSVVLLATAVTCGLLNLLVFSTFKWSIPVIGVCVVLWVLLIPLVIYVKQAVYVTILYDGIAVGLYLYLLTYLTRSDVWFYELGCPIVIFGTICVEVLTLVCRKLTKSFLGNALAIFTFIAVVCVGLEIIIDIFMDHHISLSWSAVVLTVCAILDITLITMLSHRRLRAEVRKRLHF